MALLKFIYRDESIYPNFRIRLLWCFFAGSFLVVFGEKDEFWEMIQNSGFYISIGGSVMIAIVVSEFIVCCNYYFDQYFPWRKDIINRMWLQGLVSGLSSIPLAVVLAAIYFKIRDTSLLNSGYFTYDFTVVICLVALINAYYLVLNLLQLKNAKLRTNRPNLLKPVVESTGANAPAFIFSEGKGNIVVQFDGKRFQWNKTLAETVTELPVETYFLVNRAEIVHWSAISSYEPFGSNTLKLIMKPEFAHLKVFVAQRRVKDFKEWFERVGDLKGRPDEGD